MDQYETSSKMLDHPGHPGKIDVRRRDLSWAPMTMEKIVPTTSASFQTR